MSRNKQNMPIVKVPTQFRGKKSGSLPVENAPLGCHCCGDTSGVLYIHAKCHIQAHLVAAYDQRTGNLGIHCGECGKHVAAFEVTGRVA